MENSTEVSQKTKNRTTIWPRIPLLAIYPIPPKQPKTIIQKDTCIPMFTETSFITAKIWKQPKHQSTGKYKENCIYDGILT